MFHIGVCLFNPPIGQLAAKKYVKVIKDCMYSFMAKPAKIAFFAQIYNH